MKRRNTVLVAALALIVALMAYGTVAMFSGEAHVTNVITTGTVSIQLNDLLEGVEATDDDGDGISTATLSGVMPGQPVSKVVSITNDGSEPAWVRIDLEKAIQMAPGVNAQPDTSLLHIQFDTQNWTEKDGYYYYNKALEPTQTTEPLFQVVKFSETMGNDYQNCTATIDVCGQAVQVKNNGASVMDADGWPTSQLENP